MGQVMPGDRIGCYFQCNLTDESSAYVYAVGKVWIHFQVAEH